MTSREGLRPPAIALDESLPFGEEPGELRRLSRPVLLSLTMHVALAVCALLAGASSGAAEEERDEPIEISLLARLVETEPAALAASAPAVEPAAPPARGRRARSPTRRAVPAPAPVPAEAPVEAAPAPDPFPVPSSIEPPAAVASVGQEVAERAADELAGAITGVIGGSPGGIGGVGDGGGWSGAGSTLGTGPIDGSSAAIPPRVLERIQPQYPQAARRRGIEGLVVLHLVIGRDGRVEPEHTKVVRSVPGLDAAAVAAANRWKFSPARDRSGSPLRSFIRLPIRFALR